MDDRIFYGVFIYLKNAQKCKNEKNCFLLNIDIIDSKVKQIVIDSLQFCSNNLFLQV